MGLTKVSFKKQLCHICFQSFLPVHLVKVHRHSICRNCLKLLKLSKQNLSHSSSHQSKDGTTPAQIPTCSKYSEPIAEIDTTKQDNIAKIIAREGAVFIDKVKQLNEITPQLIGTIIGRIAIYLPGLMYLDKSSELYPILSGVMTADFVTWFLFNTMQLPFVSRGAVLEFFSYGGITSLLVSEERFCNLPDEGLPMAYAILAFLATGFLKTLYWGLKVFIFEEMEEEI